MSYIDVLSPTEATAPSSFIDNATLHLVTGPAVAEKENAPLFPGLPPLHSGHPDVHMRNGIMTSWQNEVEPDSEKAFFVADLSVVYNQLFRWKRTMPRVEPFFAVKCNPDPYVLRVLAALGTGFDCASIKEIDSVLSLPNVDPSRIIYANPCKATSFLRAAKKSGVDMMTFDNTDELHKIKRIHPGAKVVLRILTDDSKSLCQFGIKFGASLESVPVLLAKARELELEVIGVSFHVGSGCYDPTVYLSAIERARWVFDIAKKDFGIDMKMLDIGGGFEDALFEQAGTVINAALADLFPVEQGVRVIAEPGRYFVSEAFRLATCIIAKRDKSAEGTQNMYYVNDGVYGAFNCLMFDHQVRAPYVLSQAASFSFPAPSAEADIDSSIWGPTCDSIDCISKSTALPNAMDVGDWLGWETMGAYTVCAASGFNGFSVSEVVYTAGVSGASARGVRELLEKYSAETAGAV